MGMGAVPPAAGAAMAGAALHPPQPGAEHPPPHPLPPDPLPPDDFLCSNLSLILSNILGFGQGSLEPAPAHPPLEQEEPVSFLWNRVPLNSGVAPPEEQELQVGAGGQNSHNLSPY